MTVNNKHKRRPYRKLTNVRVDEISCVDKGAGEGCQIKLLKRASTNTAIAEATKCLAMSVKSIAEDSNCDKNALLAQTFAQFQQHLEKLTKNNSERAEPDLSNSDVGYGGRRRRQNEEDDDETERLSADADADDEDDEKENAMTAKLKSLDAVQICKQMAAEEHAFGLSEHDLTNLIQSYAKSHAKSGESDAQAFSRIISGGDDVAKACNTALAIAKHQQWQSRTSTLSKAAEGMPGRASLRPRVTGGRAARAVDNPKSALAELQALVDEQRAQNPALSESAAWLAVYTHPDNAALAARERAENRPVATGW